MFAPGNPIQSQHDIIGEMSSGFFFKLTSIEMYQCSVSGKIGA